MKIQFYYMHYIEYSNTNISPKYLGIHLNTHELKWARPWCREKSILHP
jgi:hypothetical protein